VREGLRKGHRRATRASVVRRFWQYCPPVPSRRPASQVELPLGLEAYRNTALFSDHFLAERLPDMPWYGRRATASRTAFDEISVFYREARPEEDLVGAPEAQCEEDIIRPVLTSLGHSFLLQAPTAPQTGVKNFPDYVLFTGEEERDLARRESGSGVYGRATAIAEGKYWDRDLDKKEASARDYLTNANPSFQIVNYLIQSGKRWGILTNGRRWRLYCRDAPQPIERYYEIDLPQLLASGGQDAFFKYFYGLFSADALKTDRDNVCQVDRVLKGSSDFAADIGDELRTRVFGALVRIAAGFMKGVSDEPSQEDLNEVYDGSLTLLYRMLFVLYAEARELLPLEANASYREQLSLTTLVHEIADARERGRTYSSTALVMWNRLDALWTAIDAGDSEIGVPEYDGELFSRSGHPLLTRKSVPDAYLADALNLVGRVSGTDSSRFVDYRSLSVAHLGTVYEGLLEHQLVLNHDKLGGLEHKIELSPIRARRRETGSYYTPDAIVQHIVRETLGPIVETMSEADILGLRICDPAMGSGHFLVGAVEYLALAIATAPGGPNEYDENDLPSIKRRVVEHCIWGVDINPLAVELAKLSLWLATASSDKPLTFVDHRLRTGNSVLTMRPEDVAALLRRSRQQETTFDEAFAQQHERCVELAAMIDAADSETMVGVGQRREIFAELQEARTRLLRVGESATQRVFGVVDQEALEALVAALDGDPNDWDLALERLQSADSPTGFDFQPFLWELEFPDVFEAGGFNAVLGNPPYVNAWEMTAASPGLREGLRDLPRWKAIAKRHWDLFVLFVGLAQQIVVPSGRFGIIVANPLMREKYAAALRRSLLEGTIVSVTDFGSANVFDGVARETVCLIWENVPASDDHQVILHDPEAVVALSVAQ
jgi:hypothetical protein